MSRTLFLASYVLMLLTGCAGDAAPSRTPPAPAETWYVYAAAGAGENWSVKREGNAFVVAHPPRFSFSIPTADAQADGWTLTEASAARVRFVSRGQPSSLTVYADGRAYCDGEFKSLDPSMSDAGAIAACHASPAELSVPPLLGRVDRNTRGDVNNDGYNESCGAYELIAFGPRIEVTISPRTALLARPVLEIANLPAGTAIVTVEGQLVPSPLRLANGHLLVELPARLERPAAVNVRVDESL